MIIEFIKPPACNDFKTKLNVEGKKTKDGICFTLNNRNILIPWHNIAAIEDYDGK